MRTRTVLLIRGRLPSKEEGAALDQLRKTGAYARAVRVRPGWEKLLENCDEAYSFHDDLVAPYGGRGHSLSDTSDNIPVPKGYVLEKSGPYYRLFGPTGGLVGGKALHRKKMEKLVERVQNGSVD